MARLVQPFLPAALALAVLSGPAVAQTFPFAPSYGNARALFRGATVATPGSVFNATPTGGPPISVPCALSQIPSMGPGATASPPSIFKPPITATSHAFTNRFAAGPGNGGCR